MKRIAWTAQARADVRRLDIPTALRIFAALHRFAETGHGEVRRLQAELAEITAPHRRLSRSVHREGSDTISVKRVLHRSEAYR